ncbi:MULTISPECIES: phosphonate metabolism protein/1,5-bisphosphokinase (PRPP-forming) PhnN [unclassified Roseitalea]|uniref:phosphonate metabolism protein/1,5-bisphosphokinase (PRPP-forming) PhnN n=1 Tax=unclassified Roseitalea TaxID=2639107 RepID=UPI00273F4DD8|nr:MULTISPECIES: phosphonate metabolism protein/1,5-bisphosphokinase (PRPP-forming) PhnN [unclassified Roseitalea]
MTGVLVAVVGASGVGKDAVIGVARQRLGERHDIMFVRRTISRPADAGGEDHRPVSEAEFGALERAGAFCASWRAHGLGYGLPRAALDHVEAGGIAVANGSRRALPAIRSRFVTVRVVEITAAPEVIADRLAARGRETADQIAARLARRVEAHLAVPGLIAIDNSGPLERAGEALAKLIAELASPAVS